MRIKCAKMESPSKHMGLWSVHRVLKMFKYIVQNYYWLESPWIKYKMENNLLHSITIIIYLFYDTWLNLINDYICVINIFVRENSSESPM